MRKITYDVISKVETLNEDGQLLASSELIEAQGIEPDDKAVITDEPENFVGIVSPRIIQKLIDDLRGLML